MDTNTMMNMTSMANSLASSLPNNSNSMASAFGTAGMAAGFGGQFGLSAGRKAAELSPGSRKSLGLVNTGQSLPTQGQQAFNIQLPKNRKSGGFFGEEEDMETSTFFPPSAMQRLDKEGLNQSQSPSNPNYGGNFYSQGVGGNYGMSQQRGPISGSQFQRNLTPTSLTNQPFSAGIPQNSPNRGVITAIGQHRMMNSQSQQAPISALQKRPIGSGLSSSAAPVSNLAASFGFQSRPDSSQPNFDPSDFPSLGNRGVAPQNSLSANRNYVGMVKNPVQDQTPEFQIQQEDFPALPGAQSTLSMFVSDPGSSESPDPSKKQPQNLLSGSSYGQALNKDDKFSDDKDSGHQRKSIQIHSDGMYSRVTNIPPGMVADQFGIVGLLAIFKYIETSPSNVALVPGMELTTLGLNLNSPDNLYSTFQSPWVDIPCRPQDIDFHVPSEYLTNIYVREKLAPIKLNRYGEDLLFYLFYMNGGDVLQLAAATELYNRDWRYHKEDRVWITRAPGVEPTVKTNAYEKGTYYFFDAQNWRKVMKEFYLEYDKLEDRPQLPPTNHNPNQQAVH